MNQEGVSMFVHGVTSCWWHIHSPQLDQPEPSSSVVPGAFLHCWYLHLALGLKKRHPLQLINYVKINASGSNEIPGTLSKSKPLLVLNRFITSSLKRTELFMHNGWAGKQPVMCFVFLSVKQKRGDMQIKKHFSQLYLLLGTVIFFSWWFSQILLAFFFFLQNSLQMAPH